jgi:hypothetical protein
MGATTVPPTSQQKSGRAYSALSMEILLIGISGTSFMQMGAQSAKFVEVILMWHG